MVAFIESYGRYAVENPEFAPPVDAVLDAGDQRLDAAGFAARSGVPHLLDGRRRQLAGPLHAAVRAVDQQPAALPVRWSASDRLTLTERVQEGRAGRRSASSRRSTGPGRRAFFGYDQVYDARNLGYRGPQFSYAPMPDQYICSTFQRNERGTPGHAPLFGRDHAGVQPQPVDADPEDGRLGPGRRRLDLRRPGQPGRRAAGRSSGRTPTRSGPAYAGRSQYSLDALISYVETYGDDNLVLVFLGDHQPAPVVTGAGASRDVPITIVAPRTRRCSTGSRPGAGRPGCGRAVNAPVGRWTPSATASSRRSARPRRPASRSRAASVRIRRSPRPARGGRRRP